MNNNNNNKRLKEIINDCEGKYKDVYNDVVYCPLIPIMFGKGNCNYQSEIMVYVREDNNKYLIPRYRCLKV